jgi:hypothetical protein
MVASFELQEAKARTLFERCKPLARAYLYNLADDGMALHAAAVTLVAALTEMQRAYGPGSTQKAIGLIGGADHIPHRTLDQLTPDQVAALRDGLLLVELVALGKATDVAAGLAAFGQASAPF